MSDAFKLSTYSREYDTADQVPDLIIQNNAAAVHGVLTHLENFPHADVPQLEADHEFLILECAARGLTAAFIDDAAMYKRHKQ